MVLVFIHSVALLCIWKSVEVGRCLFSMQSFLSLIFTTVATFSERPETYIYSFEFTVFAIHDIYFVGNLAIP